MGKKSGIVFILSFSLLCSMMPAGGAAAAKKINLSSRKLTIMEGKSKTLKVKNTRKKVTWKILSGKKYITIKKKGKMSVTVKGRKKGTAKVQAKVGKKKLICRVTVKSRKKTVAAQKPKHTARPVTTDSTKPTPSSMPTVTNPPEPTEQPLDISNMDWNALVERGLVEVSEKRLLNCKKNVAGVLHIGNSITSIGYSAFAGCSRLTGIRIPASITEIEWEQPYDSSMPWPSAFFGCSSLSEITVDSENKVYDSRDNCNAIIKKAGNCLVGGCRKTVIPASVLRIGNRAFYGCDTLTGITIPEGVGSIEWNAFDSCSSLTEITIPASVKKIKEDFAFGAFLHCNSLTKIEVASDNTVYDSRNGCNAIIHTENNRLIQGCRNTVIPSGVTGIGNGAFAGCTGLSRINIPEGVTTIGVGAFSKCESLTKIKVNPDNKVYDSRDDCNAIIRTADNVLMQGCQNTVIPSDVVGICDNAFFGCSNLTGITIPGSVVTIGDNAFKSCSALTEINILDGVTQIGHEAFEDCSNLTGITIPNSVATIGSYGFANCRSLTDITLSEGITTIESGAFRGCSSLTEITIPDSVTTIGYGTFYDCSSLMTVTIPDSIKIIEGSTFEGCSSLTGIIIPNGVTGIGQCAFDGCRNLTKITIPGSIAYIDQWAFRGCSALSEITIPGSITDIGYEAFSGVKKVIYSGAASGAPWGAEEVVFPHLAVKAVGGHSAFCMGGFTVYSRLVMTK